MIRRPPRSTRTDTLFPYTTLFRSQRFYSLTGKLEIDFDWATLTSITNYSNNDFLYEIDGDNGFHTSEFGPGLVSELSLRNRARQMSRSEERRVGNACVSTCRLRTSP